MRHITDRRHFLIGTAMLGAATRATAVPFDGLKDYLEAERKAGAFPGASVVVGHRGEIAFSHYTGTYHSAAGEDKPYRPGVVGTFYSFSKGVSATVLMTAVQDGTLDLDAPIAATIPDFAANGKEKITLRQVLSHAAGIPAAPSPFKPVRTGAEWTDAVQAVCDAKLEFAPGSRTAYHAFGTLIAAAVLRRKLGDKPWNDLCKARLFDPLGTKSLSFDEPAHPTLTIAAPKGATGQDTARAFLAGHPAGGCSGTPEDALTVLQLHLAMGTWAGKELLTAKSMAAMHTAVYATERAAAVAAGKTPVHEPWAVGWLLRGAGPNPAAAWFGFRDHKNPAVFGHAGIDTVLGAADPAKDVAVVFTTTRSPKSAAEATRLRNDVVNRAFAAVS